MKDELLDCSKNMLKDAVFQLVSYHQDVKGILAEAGSLNTSTAVENGVQESEFFIPDLLSRCVRNGLGNSSDLHTAETCAAQLLDIVGKLKNIKTDVSELLAPLCVQVKLVKELMKGQYFNRPRFLNILCNEMCLPVPVLYVLHEEFVMSLDSYIRFKQSDSKFISGLSEELLLCRTTKFAAKQLSGIMNLLINYSFPEKSDSDQCLKKICTSVLLQTLHKHLDMMQNEQVLSAMSLVPTNNLIGAELSMKKCCCFLLQQILIYHPCSVVEAVNKQKNWMFAKLPVPLVELFKQFMLVLDKGDILEVLNQMLDKQEVNWYYYSAFWSTFIICTEHSKASIEDFLVNLFKVGLEESDLELLVKGFLIGRQCCQEGSHIFMTYQDWFQQMFGDSVRSLTNSKKTFTCLMKALTDLVPFDQPSYLRVHILRPPFVPPKCKDLLSDYIILAKTRLADLKEPLEQVGMYEETSGTSLSKNQIEEDVQKALAAFETNNKIPSAVMEASIFRKSYFIGKFIPVLLKPRPLPDIPDTRMKFIEVLTKVEKIPPNMYRTYEVSCKQEAENLLQGVFMEIDSEEDDGLEMTMSAMEQYNYRLSQILDKVAQGQTKQFSEMVSILREKIDVLLNSQESVASTDNVTKINIDRPELNKAHVKIIDGIMNLFCKVSEVCLTRPKPDLTWASQIVDVLGEFKKLHKPLFVRILRLVTLQVRDLESHHITGLGLLLTFLSLKSSNFGLVELFPCTGSCCQGQQYFAEKLWSVLPITTGEQMLISLRLMSAYLFCVFSAIDSSCLLEEDYNRLYPIILIKKFIFLCQRFIPEIQSRPSEQDQPVHLMTALYIYKSDQFREIHKNTQISFEEWLQMELNVCPGKDLLSHFDRQEYVHNCIYIHYMTTQNQDGGCYHDYKVMCSLVLNTLVQADLRLLSNNGDCCQICLQNRQNTNSKVFILQYLQELCWLLPSTRGSQQESTKQDSRPWLLTTLRELCRNLNSSLSIESVVKSFYSIISCLPQYLFYTDSTMEPCVDVDLVVNVINCELREGLSEGCVFPRNVYLYLLQGLLQIQQTVNVEQILTSCPILVTSLLVYLPHCTHLTEKLKIQNRELVTVQDWMNRSLADKMPDFDDCNSWMFSAALLALIVNRKTADVIISQLQKQKSPKLNRILGEFMILFTAYSAFQTNEVEYINILDVLMATFPLLLQWLPSESHVQYLSSKSSLSIIPYKIMRYISTRPTNQMSGTECLSTIVKLYSQVVSLIDDDELSVHKPTLKSGLELSTFVKTCIKRAPDSVLKNLDQELLKKCGMDILLTVKESLQR